ncbi:putative chromosome region maintenance protein 1/exportin [Schistosoma mansoni]|nr:putative chromosome region maintenance protein 1/exportin [Schistosoma mansoni]|eukprot:XP_018648537.1 putative chromosome region maintenance protein 1/exportin [Schistosoma mansoni]
MILVEILKHEWPNNWSTFISDIVGASKTNESLCQNNMVILRLLSEEVFDFSLGQMTQTKAKHLKDSMCQQFSLIFQLCQYVLENSQNASLVVSTLETLLRFTHWIPLGYIFETNLIQTLVFKFFNVPLFRNVTLKCLAEIAGVLVDEYETQLVELFVSTTDKLKEMLPLETRLKEAYERGSNDEQSFIQNLAIFYTTFLKGHSSLVEKPELIWKLQDAYAYLLMLSEVEEREIFKICLEYWNILVSDLYRESLTTTVVGTLAESTTGEGRSKQYAPILSKLRRIMISRMARPEEVLVVENEHGEVVREFMKDTDSLNLYKSMRETLVYLTHLDYSKTLASSILQRYECLNCSRCSRCFIYGEAVEFIEEILKEIDIIINDLQPQQVHTFYEAVGVIISAQLDSAVEARQIERLFRLPNQIWDGILVQAACNIDLLRDFEVVQQLCNLLKTNHSACKSLGHSYLVQLGRIYLDMLNVYKIMSQNIGQAVATNGEQVTKQPLIRSMRSVKKAILNLLSCWIKRTTDPVFVAENILPPLLDAVADDYQKNLPAAREAEVLSLMATLVNRLEDHILPALPRVLDAVFQSTLEMIDKDLEEFPEHRTNFFTLLQAVNAHCFSALLSLTSDKFKLILDSVIWAIKHTMRQVSETGLNILHTMLVNMSSANSEKRQVFFKTFFMDILQHMFAVITDRSQTGI